MNELTSNRNKEGQLLKNEINKYKFFFSIQKMIDKIGVQKYEEIKKIWEISCTQEQIDQLNKEERELTNLVKKAISKNPYENENLNRFYGDSAIDFYNGVLKKGEDFVTKVVNFDEETHKNLSRKISSELFGYCIPYESYSKKKNLNKERMQKQINDANNFLEALEKCEELSESYKEKLKTGVNYLIDSGNKLMNNQIDKNFDIESLKSNVFLLDKIEEFARPIFLKVGLRNGLAHAGWENLISEQLLLQASQNFVDKVNFKELIKPFDSKYLVAFENGDTENLKELSDNFENNFDNILQNGILETNNKAKPRKIKP